MLLNKMGEAMVKIFQALIKKFFTAFLQAFLNVAVGQLNNTVLQIVQNAGSKTDWTNEAKRQEAFSQIKQIALSNGKELRDSTIALAIELAVKILKGGTI